MEKSEAVRRALETARAIPEPQLFDDGTLIQLSGSLGADLLDCLDAALETSPNDIELLIAKYSILMQMHQGETAGKVLAQIKKIDPNHIDVLLFEEKNNMTTWAGLPAWDLNMSITPAIRFHLSKNRSFLAVRDGLSIGLAVFCVVNPNDFPSGFPSQAPLKWEPVFAETPYGPMIAHYTLFADNPRDPYKGERFASISREGTLSPNSGWALFSRLKYVSGIFVVLTDGQRVFVNKRYVPDDATRAKWDKVAEQTSQFIDEMSHQNFSMACQWHMDNFSMSNIRF